MLELGNEAQVRAELEGNTDFEQQSEDELIHRVAVAEQEQESYEDLHPLSRFLLIAVTIAGAILTVVCFI
ncbi:MAG: hypothetical protein ACOX41_06555 [Anaerovoracaceae bacterium]